MNRWDKLVYRRRKKAPPVDNSAETRVWPVDNTAEETRADNNGEETRPVDEVDDGADEGDAEADDGGANDSDDDADYDDEDEADIDDDEVGESVEDVEANEVGDDYRDCSDADSGDDVWDDARLPDRSTFSYKDNNGDEDVIEVPENSEELLALAKTFNSGKDFKLAVLSYSLKTGYNIQWYRSQETKLGAKCGDSSCPWRVYCSYEKRKQKMMIKVYINEHTCTKSGSTKLLKISTIAYLFEERLRLNPKITKQEMVDEIKREYNMVVTAEQCSKAKTKVIGESKASHAKHFARIWDYQGEILQSNEDTTFDIETIPGPAIGSKLRFYRLYICFKSQRISWKETCRPIIGLDGAFLKWDIKGQLLTAVGRDGDNRIVPIAWAVVEIENETNWDWFMRHLASDLGLEDGRNVAIISDRQKGLVRAVWNVLPAAEHRQCGKHVFENWKKDSHDLQLKRMFWKIARSYTPGEYEDNMNELKRYNPIAHNSLQLQNPMSWCRAFFREEFCSNDNLNNLSESFNRTIRQARKLPLLDMLEEIRRQCMVRNAKRFIIASRLKTNFTKRAHAEIEKMVGMSQDCVVHMARNNVYEVDMNGVGYSVDMNERTCGCRKWQMIGIPCEHAMRVIITKKLKVEDYVREYYTKDMWCRTYMDGIKPVQGMKLWPRLRKMAVLPPPWRKDNPGRPSNYTRKRSRNETASSSNKHTLSRKNRIMSCSNCKQDGHNKKSCKNPTVVHLSSRGPRPPRSSIPQQSSELRWEDEIGEVR